MNRALTVAFDGKRATTNATGLGWHSRTLLRTLARSHPELELLLFSPKPTQPAFEQYLQIPSLQAILPSERLRNPLSRYLWRSRRMGRLAHHHGADLFHGLSAMLPETWKGPSVVTFHDLLYLHFEGDYPLWDRRYYHRTASRAAERADVILSVSEATANDLVHHYQVPREKIVVSYQSAAEIFTSDSIHPAEAQHLKSLYELPDAFILSVGSFNKRKNHRRLLTAYAEVVRDIEDHQLVLVGGACREQEALSDLARKLGVQDQVTFLLDVPFRDSPGLIKLSSFVAYLSLKEGFGLPVLEALSCAKPVLTSNTSSLREVGGEASSLLVDPTDVEDIAQGLLKLSRDGSCKQRLQAAIPAHIEKFSSHRVIERVYGAYQRALSSRVAT